MSKPVLPPASSVHLNLTFPETWRDRTPDDVFRLLNEKRAEFLWMVAREVSRCFTSKPAEVAFVNDARDQTEIEAAIAARSIFTKKG